MENIQILGIAFFVLIFLSFLLIPDWIRSMKKCSKCGKRFNKQYVSYQYGCGDYECRCKWENKKLGQVIMLPTEKVSRIVLNNNHLFFHESSWKNHSKEIQNQHLYITSDDEIKEGDWKYCSKTNYITQFVSKAEGSIADKCECCKKIIATTDPSLKELVNSKSAGFDEPTGIPLLQIPESFIRIYAESNGTIKEVEYKEEITNVDSMLKVIYKPSLRRKEI